MLLLLLHTFGLVLKQHRLSRGLTLRELEAVSGIANSNLALMESSRKPCGPVTADRIAKALQLTGDEYARFCLLAMTTTKARKTFRHAERLDPTLWTWLTSELRAPPYQIKAEAIRGVVWRPGIGPFILLKNGRVFEIALTVKEADSKQMWLPLAPRRTPKIQPEKQP